MAAGEADWGGLYQGWYRSFPAQDDGHHLTLCGSAERNALAAGPADRAEEWPWGSASARRHRADPITPWQAG